MEALWDELRRRVEDRGPGVEVLARVIRLGFGTDVEVLAPESLRQDFAEVARAIVELYAPPVARPSLPDV